MSKQTAYQLILTPSEVLAVHEWLASATENADRNPFTEEDIASATNKITALAEYVKADRAAEEAEAVYREALENVHDAFVVEAF